MSGSASTPTAPGTSPAPRNDSRRWRFGLQYVEQPLAGDDAEAMAGSAGESASRSPPTRRHLGEAARELLEAGPPTCWS